MNLTNTNKPISAESAERAILSVILQRPEQFVSKAKAEDLHPDLFVDHACSTLLRIINEFDANDRSIELISLTESLNNSGDLEMIGGPAGLATLYSYATNSQHWNEHVAIVKERYSRRVAISGANKVIASATEGDAESALQTLSEAREAVLLSTAKKQAFQDAQESYERFLAAMNERMDGGDMPGQETGIVQLDELGGGMRPGELWIVCGETSAGKSALAYQMAVPAINDDKKVLIMTLEMTSDEVFARLMSCRSRIDLGRIMKPRGMDKGQLMQIKRSSDALRQSNLLISDQPNMSIDYVCAQAEMEAEMGGVDLLVVDYLQLLDGGRKTGDSQEQELATYSRRLKQLAKKLKCPVISPAQINDEGRLRGSRAIGHDADVVLKIQPDGIAVAKYRNAPKNDVLPLGLVGQFQRFETIQSKPQNQYRR